jgi:hypothetical protein
MLFVIYFINFLVIECLILKTIVSKTQLANLILYHNKSMELNSFHNHNENTKMYCYRRT